MVYRCAQVAVDTTLVSLLRRDGTPHVRSAGQRGWGKMVFGDTVVPSTTGEGQDAPCALRSPDKCQDGVVLAVEHYSRVRKCSGLCAVSPGKARCSGT